MQKLTMLLQQYFQAGWYTARSCCAFCPPRLTYNIFLAISLTVPRAKLCVISSIDNHRFACSTASFIVRGAHGLRHPNHACWVFFIFIALYLMSFINDFQIKGMHEIQTDVAEQGPSRQKFSQFFITFRYGKSPVHDVYGHRLIKRKRHTGV